MKKYKIQIAEEVSNGNQNPFFKRSREAVIFQSIIEESEIDIGAVMRTIVSQKGRSYGQKTDK